jgi:hypothetical protein
VNELFRLEVYYRKLADPTSPMSLNLTEFERIRFHFLSSNFVVNFNVEVWSGTKFSDQGVNLGASFSPFTQDFVIKEFTQDSVDLKAIEGMIVIFQSAIAGQAFAIQKFVKTGQSAFLARSAPNKAL